jgi:hypothetical protein
VAAGRERKLVADLSALYLGCGQTRDGAAAGNSYDWPGPRSAERKARNGELTETQAERFAWDHYLAPLDNATVKPFSTVTLEQFWDQRYLPHLNRKKKYATQSQYKSLWKRWIKPGLGNCSSSSPTT